MLAISGGGRLFLLMVMKAKLLFVLCLIACLTACEKQKAWEPLPADTAIGPAPTNKPAPGTTPQNPIVITTPPPTFDSTAEKPSLPDIDPATISPVNGGFTIDLTGPGSQDFLIMNGDSVYWSKGDKKNIVVLTVKGDIIAYNINNDGIRVYNRQNKGFIAKYLGANNGVPYFGKLEEQ